MTFLDISIFLHEVQLIMHNEKSRSPLHSVLEALCTRERQKVVTFRGGAGSHLIIFDVNLFKISHWNYILFDILILKQRTHHPKISSLILIGVPFFCREATHQLTAKCFLKFQKMSQNIVFFKR